MADAALRIGPPHWTGPSTNALPVNRRTGEFASGTVGFGLNPGGLSLDRRGTSLQTGEITRHAKTCGNVADAGEGGGAAVNKTAARSCVSTVLAPRARHCKK